MADKFWPKTDVGTRFRLACVASVRAVQGTRVKDRAKNGVSKTAGKEWGRKEGNFPPSPPPSPCFIFWLSFHFSRGQNWKSHSSVFPYSATKRKRLLRRLDFPIPQSCLYPWKFMPQKVVHPGWKTRHVYPVGKPKTAIKPWFFKNFFRFLMRTSVFCSNIWKA